MIRILTAALLATALPAAAQTTTGGVSAATATAVENFNSSRSLTDRTILDPNETDAGFRDNGIGVQDDAGRGYTAAPTIGGQVGDAGENATAYRGDYRAGECPVGTTITTFGTCAVLN